MPTTPTSSPSNSFDPAAFHRDDGIAKRFIAATLLWIVVASCVAGGLLLLLLNPDWSNEHLNLTWGRVRPIQTTLMFWAVVGNAGFASVYYALPRLCGRRMASTVLSRLHFWAWQSWVVASIATFPLGLTQSKTLMEGEWWLDVAFAVITLGLLVPNVVATVALRQVERLYVSAWFFLAGVLLLGVGFPLANLSDSFSNVKSDSTFPGTADAILHGLGFQTVLVSLVGFLSVGTAYYFIPRLTRRPLASYPLIVVHFWALVIAGIWSSPLWLHGSPVSDFLSSLGSIFGLIAWLPVLATVWLLLRNLQSDWVEKLDQRDTASSDRLAGRCFTFAVLGLLILAIHLPILGVQRLHWWVQYSDWTTAMACLAVLGWSTMLFLGMAYFLAPRMSGRVLTIGPWERFHFYGSLCGVALVVVSFGIAGVTQSAMWFATDSVGNLAYVEFVDSVTASATWRAVAALGFAILMLASMVGATRLLIHMVGGIATATSDEPLTIGDPQAIFKGRKTPRLTDAPVLGLAKHLEASKDMLWHRSLERSPTALVALVAFAFLAAMIVQVGPVLATAAVTEGAGATKYTPLQWYGRDLYIQEGCVQCHSQNVRPIVAETKRYGALSSPSESTREHHIQWGLRRIGPDLAREGGKQTSVWHWKHLSDPRSMTEGSVMPSFEYLTSEPINYEQLIARSEAGIELGAVVPIEDAANILEISRREAERVTADIVGGGGPVLVEGQLTIDMKAVALIAYLQRLGI
ncbi:MAG: cbb3-type cytochrome c oxidase subunit II [Planctomycetota bacterium]